MGNDGAATYAQRLKPKQVQKVLTELGIPWQNYKSNNAGWTPIPADHFIHSVHSEGYTHIGLVKPAVNIQNGGWIDNWYAGLLKSVDYDLEADPENAADTLKGDIVDLVRMFRSATDTSKEAHVQAIQWIQETLGKRINDQDQFDNKILAKDYLEQSLGVFVRVPKELLSSNISSASKIIWMEIFDQCRKGKNCSWPSIRTIQNRCSVSRSTVIRSLKELEDHSFLVIKKKEGRNNLYYPVLPKSESNQCQNETGGSVNMEREPVSK